MAFGAAKPPLKVAPDEPSSDDVGGDGDEGSMDPKVQAAKVIGEAFSDGDYEAAADALASFFDMCQSGGMSGGGAGPEMGPPKKPMLKIAIGREPPK